MGFLNILIVLGYIYSMNSLISKNFWISHIYLIAYIKIN